MKKYGLGWSLVVLACGFVFQARATNCPKSDYWDPSTEIEGGEFDGECIVTDLQRPVTILAKGPFANLNLASGELLIANFRHEKKFWLAVVRDNATSEVAFEKQPIPGLTFKGETLKHVRVNFKLSKPLELIYQQASEPLSDADLAALVKNPALTRVANIVTSIEAGSLPSTKDMPWNPAEHAGSYPLVARFASYASLSEDPVGPPASNRYPLTYSGLTYQPRGADFAKANHFALLSYLKFSHDTAFGEKYELVGANCADTALRVLDKLFGKFYRTDLILDGVQPRALDAITNIVDQRLRVRGLIN